MRHCYSTIITSFSERLSIFRRVHAIARIGYLWGIGIATGPIALVPVIERITNKGIITSRRGGGTGWGEWGGGNSVTEGLWRCHFLIFSYYTRVIYS
jgi:hypothetical protein